MLGFELTTAGVGEGDKDRHDLSGSSSPSTITSCSAATLKGDVFTVTLDKALAEIDEEGVKNPPPFKLCWLFALFGDGLGETRAFFALKGELSISMGDILSSKLLTVLEIKKLMRFLIR